MAKETLPGTFVKMSSVLTLEMVAEAISLGWNSV